MPDTILHLELPLSRSRTRTDASALVSLGASHAATTVAVLTHLVVLDREPAAMGVFISNFVQSFMLLNIRQLLVTLYLAYVLLAVMTAALFA